MSQTRNSPPRIACALLIASTLPLILGSTGRTSNLNERVLAAHNRERNAAGIPPLQWNPKLEASAAAWGKHLARIGHLVHYPDNPGDPDPEGENLWAGTRGYYSPEDMVGLWAAEKKHFRPGKFPANSRTGDPEDIGHYTQLMWRTTTEVGCALVRGTKDEFLVCRYSEGGNVIGEEPF